MILVSFFPALVSKRASDKVTSQADVMATREELNTQASIAAAVGSLDVRITHSESRHGNPIYTVPSALAA